MSSGPYGPIFSLFLAQLISCAIANHPLLAQLMSCAITNHPLGVIVVVGVIVVGIVDK